MMEDLLSLIKGCNTLYSDAQYFLRKEDYEKIKDDTYAQALIMIACKRKIVKIPDVHINDAFKSDLISNFRDVDGLPVDGMPKVFNVKQDSQNIFLKTNVKLVDCYVCSNDLKKTFT